MNNPEEIYMEIDLDGTMRVEAKGVVGQGCDALTAELEAALGETTSDEKKPEWHRQAFQTLGTGNKQQNVNKQQN